MPQHNEFVPNPNVAQSKKFDIQSLLTHVSRENLSKLAKPLLALLLLTGGAQAVGAQDVNETEVAVEAGSLMVIQNAVTLRGGADTSAAAFGTLEPGTEVVIGNTSENDGYLWGHVLQINENGVWVDQTGRFIALNSVSGERVFAVQATPEAQAAPEAPTEAPTEVATEAAATLEAPANEAEIISQAENAMRAIGVENPHFSGPMAHDNGLRTWHLDNSSYYLGLFSTTNGDYLVSYCAPVAVATQATYAGIDESPLTIANGLVDEFQYNTSTQVMARLAGGDEANIDIGGVNYRIHRWELSDEAIEDHIDDLAIGESTIVVFRNVADTSKVGHLVTVQRVGEDQYVISQSNTAEGMFFRDATNSLEASRIGGASGGVFVTTGDGENISNYIYRISTWYYATGIAGMNPEG